MKQRVCIIIFGKDNQTFLMIKKKNGLSMLSAKLEGLDPISFGLDLIDSQGIKDYVRLYKSVITLREEKITRHILLAQEIENMPPYKGIIKVHVQDLRKVNNYWADALRNIVSYIVTTGAKINGLNI